MSEESTSIAVVYPVTADALRAVAPPTLADPESSECLTRAVGLVRQAEEILRDFGDDISHSVQGAE